MKKLTITNPITEKVKSFTDYKGEQVLDVLEQIIKHIGFSLDVELNIESTDWIWSLELKVNGHKLFWEFNTKHEGSFSTSKCFDPSIKFYNYWIGKNESSISIPLYVSELSPAKLNKIKEGLEFLIKQNIADNSRTSKVQDNAVICTEVVKGILEKSEQFKHLVPSFDQYNLNDYAGYSGFLSMYPSDSDAQVIISFKYLKAIYTKKNETNTWEISFKTIERNFSDFEEFYSTVHKEQDVAKLLFSDIVSKY